MISQFFRQSSTHGPDQRPLRLDQMQNWLDRLRSALDSESKKEALLKIRKNNYLTVIWNFVRDKRINSEDGSFLRIASFRANRRISLKIEELKF